MYPGIFICAQIRPSTWRIYLRADKFIWAQINLFLCRRGTLLCQRGTLLVGGSCPISASAASPALSLRQPGKMSSPPSEDPLASFDFLSEFLAAAAAAWRQHGGQPGGSAVAAAAWRRVGGGSKVAAPAERRRQRGSSAATASSAAAASAGEGGNGSTAAAVATNVETGLTSAEASKRLAENGPNELSEKVKRTIWQRIWHQINNVLVYVLLTVAAVSILQAVRQWCGWPARPVGRQAERRSPRDGLEPCVRPAQHMGPGGGPLGVRSGLMH